MNDSNNFGKQQVLLEMQTAGLPADLTEQIYKFSEQLRRGETRATKHVHDLTQDILATYREEMASFLRHYLYGRWKTQAPQWLQTGPLPSKTPRPSLQELRVVKGSSDIEHRALSLVTKILDGTQQQSPCLIDVAQLTLDLSRTEWSRMAVGYQLLFEDRDAESLACLKREPTTRKTVLRVCIYHARAIANAALGNFENAVADYGKASEESLSVSNCVYASPLRYLGYSSSMGSPRSIEEAFEHSSSIEASPSDVDRLERIALGLPRGSSESLIRRLIKKANPDQSRILLATLKEIQ